MSRKGTIHKGSWNEYLSTFKVNERRYVETTLERYPQDMRTINTPGTRRPESISHMKFAASLFTAVSSSKAGDIRYLICIERTA